MKNVGRGGAPGGVSARSGATGEVEDEEVEDVLDADRVGGVEVGRAGGLVASLMMTLPYRHVHHEKRVYALFLARAAGRRINRP